MRTLGSIINNPDRPQGNYDNSKKSLNFVKKVFGDNIDYDFDEDTQELTIKSAYRNLILKDIVEKENNIEVNFGLPGDEYFNIRYFLSDISKEGLEEKSLFAIAKSYQTFINAFRKSPLTDAEMNTFDISTKTNVISFLERAIDKNAKVALLVHFYKPEGTNPSFNVVFGRDVITQSDNYQQLDSVLIVNNKFKYIPKEAGSIPVSPSTPEIPVTNIDDLPF